MELKNLKASVTELPTDELMALVRDIRQSRRTPKKTYAQPKKATVAKPKAELTLEQLMNALPPEKILELLKQAKKE